MTASRSSAPPAKANSLSVDERIALLERLVSDGIPAQVLLPGTGCCAVPDTVRLTERAVQLGVAGVLMLPPFYYKNVSDDGLFGAFAEVIERVGDGRLRVYLYHFPQMTGVPFTPALIERLLARYPETIAGMKDSSGDLANMTGAAARFPGFDVFCGSDERCCRCCAPAAPVASPASSTSRRRWRPRSMRHGAAAIRTSAEQAQAKLTAVRERFWPIRSRRR